METTVLLEETIVVESSRLKTSRSAAVHATLDYSMIDTDVHTNDFTPVFEDYIANYGGTLFRWEFFLTGILVN